MLKIVSSNRFKKDLKLAIKRGYNIGLLEEVVNTLASCKSLEPKYDELVLYLSRTGTHSDLF